MSHLSHQDGRGDGRDQETYLIWECDEDGTPLVCWLMVDGRVIACLDELIEVRDGRERLPESLPAPPD